jgi:hypothetical protein
MIKEEEVVWWWILEVKIIDSNADVRLDCHEIRGCGDLFIKREVGMKPPGR